jgi:hypothetical protein
MSDVFSFGLILYELTLNKIACMVGVKHEVPDIPGFVLPSAREVITECWAEEPGDSFDGIVD